MKQATRQSEEVIAARAVEVFHEQQTDLVRCTDRMFAVLMVMQWIAGIIAAVVLSPLTWEGTWSETHLHVWAAVLLGGALTAYPVYMVLTRPGHRVTRHVIAVAQMLTAALLIHLTGGRIETHFHIFGSLAFLAFYRDRSVLLAAAVVVVIDHLWRGIYWPQSVFGVLTAPLWRPFEHAGWVVFELTFLLVAIRQGLREMRMIADRQARMEAAQQSIEQEVLDRTAELQRQQERTRAILDTAADGILTIDDRGIVQTINPAAEQIFGYSASEIVGRNVSKLMPEPYAEAHDGYLNNYLRTGEKKVIGIGREVVGKRVDGTTFPLDLAVSESKGGVFTGIVRDITERKAIDRMKTEFISTVSHELRTPLTSIRGSLGLIHGGVGGELPAQAAKLVGIALNNSERLVRLVNDILDIEKIEAGRMEFRLERQELVGLIEEAVSANAAYGQQHEVGIAFGGASEDVTVEADRDRILQVLTNLMSNAIKFSPPGEDIHVALVRAGANTRVEVSDCGPGIPEEFRSRIFGKFAQADASDQRQKGGTGLGLSISKAIVEHHGGHIGFRTEPGVGTTFHFELPALASVPEPEPVAASEEQQSTPDARARVLVCEDDPDVAHLLCLMLQQSGVATEIAADAQQAETMLAERHYDAMTLDLMLPGKSGLQLLRELRRQPATQHLPIVVVSAKANEGKDELNGDAVGVVDWLAKPINEERLAAAVESAVRTSQSASDHRPRILHVEDDADLAEVVAITLDPVGDVTRAADLVSARAALAARDFDVVLLDLDLPDGNGLDLMSELRQTRRSVSVVLFSASDPGADAVGKVAAALVKSRTSNQQLVDEVVRLVELGRTTTQVSS